MLCANRQEANALLHQLALQVAWRTLKQKAMLAGFPTFPVLPRSHFEIFDGEVFPPSFLNQDADPFLFQLYRRVGASRLLSSSAGALSNGIGGAHSAARYTERHIEWSFSLLDAATAKVKQWLCRQQHQRAADGTLTVDVLIPTFRCDPAFLEPLISTALAADGARVPASTDPSAQGTGQARTVTSAACGHRSTSSTSSAAHLQAQRAARTLSVNVVVACDDPGKRASFAQLRRRYEQDCRVRLRMQARNTGASAARNRCLGEAAAEWVIFLDDDVIADEHLVQQYASAIVQWGSGASGFVGSTSFPTAVTARQRGVHIAGVTFFWGIADAVAAGGAVPWGPTASLCVRRVRGVRFQLAYPKTGGGEDVAFCNDVCSAIGMPLRSAPSARAQHPYWNGGAPALSRFWGWAAGDSLLLDAYPHLTYRSAPNVTELVGVLLGLVVAAACIAAACVQWTPALKLMASGPPIAAALIGADLSIDCAALWRRAAARAPEDLLLRRANCAAGLTATQVACTAVQAKLVVYASELGRVWGHMQRGQACMLRNVGRRYMWWGTSRLDIVAQEQERAQQRCIVLCTVGCASAALLAVWLR